MFEEQYTALADAVDTIAERIRAVGAIAPAGYAAFRELTAIEETGNDQAADAMVPDLLTGHETVAATARKTLQTADEAGDEVTVDLMVQRINVHDTAAWILCSTLG